MMKTRLAALTALAACGVALAGCGGSSDDGAGSPTAFSTVPTEVTFTAPAGATTCSAGGTATFFIYGGTAPYTLDNTFPAYVQLDRTSVSNRGGSFAVTTLGGCVSPAVIAVTDKLGHTITATVSNTLGS